MVIRDLREWIAAVEQIGQIKNVSGAELTREIGGIVDWFQEEMGTPALLFDDIPGYPGGYRVLANSTISKERVAITFGLDPGISAMDIVCYWKDFLHEHKLVKPRVLDTGKIEENIRRNDEVNLLDIPTPVWHEHDGGPYLGTGCLVVQRDPDTGWVNLGCYRVQTFDRNTLGIMITAGRHGDAIRKKYWAGGEPCPVAIVAGGDPLLMIMAGLQIAYGICEYDVAGAVRGEPIDLILTPEHRLPVPANAEIVVEGTMAQDDLRAEGPFGEWTGYYASGVRPQPVIRANTLMFRNDPILLGAVPRRPPNDDQYTSSFLGSGAMWHELEAAGLEGIKGVWALEASASRMFHVVAIQQMYPGHAKQVALAATSCHSGNYATRYTMVVDEDIDPTNVNDVIWAMCTRVDPREDIEMIRRGWSSPLDPMSYPEDKKMFNARVLIDACRPWERINTFPKVAQNSVELRKAIIEKWGALKS